MRKAHEDRFLQHMEHTEVKRNVNVLKREKHSVKDKVDGVDMLADSSLYDLKVLHNGGQRSKSLADASRRRPESAGAVVADRSGCEPGSRIAGCIAAGRVRGLCKELTGDLRKNCARFTDLNLQSKLMADLGEFISYDRIEDAKTKKDREQREMLAGFGGFFKSTNAKTKPGFVDDIAEPEGTSEPVKKFESVNRRHAIVVPVAAIETVALPPLPSEVAALAAPVKALPRKVPERPNRVASKDRQKWQRNTVHETLEGHQINKQRLGELVGFLIGCCGSVGAAFKHLDINDDRCLSLQEWQDGVRKLGFIDDVSYVFKLLGKEGDEIAMLDEVQMLFEPFLKRIS